MSKRIICCLLIGLLLLSFAGCDTVQESPDSSYLQPFSFYYRTVDTDFSSPEGLIRAEIRDLGEKNYSDAELFALYFLGPQSTNLTDAVAKGTELLGAYRTGSLFHVRLRQSGEAPSALDQSIAFACIAETAFQLNGITQIQIHLESLGGQVLRDVTLSRSDILLYDSGNHSPISDTSLYFSDADGHLLSEKRTFPAISEDQQPAYVIEQLLQGPQTAGLQSPLPQGTVLLDINLDMGLCSVDFNADFYNNRPKTEREELLVLFSVINSLCTLEDVTAVQFYVEGRRLDSYTYMDLSQPFAADLSMAGPIREDANEFEGTLCLPGLSSGILHRLPVRIRMKGGFSREMALLQALFTHAPQNTLPNPTYGMPLPESVSVSGKTCTVSFSGSPLSELDPAQRQKALRCIAASLCSSPEIGEVMILERGISLTPEALQPKSDWFYQELP